MGAVRLKKSIRCISISLVSLFIFYHLQGTSPVENQSRETVIQPQPSTTNKEIKKVSLEFQDSKFVYQLYSSTTSGICDGKRVVVFVASAPQNFEARKLARQTWASKTVLPSDYLVQFVIGAQTNYDVEVRLHTENEEYTDLIRYGAPDTYRLLFMKTYVIFTWFKWQCFNSTYFVKMDDDTVLHPRRVDHFLKHEFELVASRVPTIFCNVQRHHHPFRNPLSKLFVSFLSYPYFTYPDYCQGGAYMTTANVIHAIFLATNTVSMIPLEDVLYTGLISQEIGIKLYATPAFCYETNLVCDYMGIPMRAASCGVSRSEIIDEYNKLTILTCSSVDSGYQHCLEDEKVGGYVGGVYTKSHVEFEDDRPNEIFEVVLITGWCLYRESTVFDS